MQHLIIKHLGRQPYEKVYQHMQDFTNQRTSETSDELWLVEHPPVLTQGQAGKPEHLLNPVNIPLIQTDRGGQITYHGPGQLVAYTLFDIKRLNIGIRQLVRSIEQAMINLLASYQLCAHRKDKAPGVYIDQAKICAIGLRVRRFCAYHGLALNIDMDLSPFLHINPCGYENLSITQLSELIGPVKMEKVADKMIECLIEQFGYKTHEQYNGSTSGEKP